MISVLPSRFSTVLAIDRLLRHFQWNHAVLVVYTVDRMYNDLAAAISTIFARSSLPLTGTVQSVELFIDKVINVVDDQLNNIQKNLEVIMQDLKAKGELVQVDGVY